MPDYTTQDSSQSAASGVPHMHHSGASAPKPLEIGANAAEPEGAATASTLAVGEYLVGDAEDTLLNGHPDIRY